MSYKQVWLKTLPNSVKYQGNINLIGIVLKYKICNVDLIFFIFHHLKKYIGQKEI